MGRRMYSQTPSEYTKIAATIQSIFITATEQTERPLDVNHLQHL